VLSPVQIVFRQLALIEEKTVITIQGLEIKITSNDIIVISSLAAGSVALGTFFTQVIIPQTKRVRRKK
jgi:hypothetical protein